MFFFSLFLILPSFGQLNCFPSQNRLENTVLSECSSEVGVLFCTQFFPCSFTSAKAYCEQLVPNCTGITDENGDNLFTVRCDDSLAGPDDDQLKMGGTTKAGANSWSKYPCITSGCQQELGEQGFIMFLDYSGSIDDTEWSQMLTFVVDVLNQAIPAGSRVAAAGFGHGGTDEYKIPRGWITDWTDPADAAARIPSAYYGNSYTYLGAGLEWLLGKIPSLPTPLTWSELDGSPITLMIFTDGEATDPGVVSAQRADLDARGVKTLVIGIGDGFSSSHVAPLVQNQQTDIIESASFNELDSIIEEINDITCRANQLWKISQVKPAGNEKYIEFVIDGTEFDGKSVVRVKSNLINGGQADISESTPNWPGSSLEQGDRVVLGNQGFIQGGTGAKRCVDSSSCHYFQVDFSADYTGNNINKISDWKISLEQIFTNDGVETKEALEPTSGVNWDSSFPEIPDSDFAAGDFGFSFEIKAFTLSQTEGDSYRRSCTDTVESIGAESVAICPVCSTDAECNDAFSNGQNTCDIANGCVCIPEGYFESQSNQCDRIPAPSSCNVEVDIDNRVNHAISFNKAVSTIAYYEVTSGGSTQRLNSFNYTGDVITFSFGSALTDPVSVRSIGVMESTDIGNGQAQLTPQRWSFAVQCVESSITLPPSSAPTALSGAPSLAPQTITRYVLLSKGDTNRNNNTIQFQSNEIPKFYIRVVPSPEEDLVVGWEARDSDQAGSTIASGEVTFPKGEENEKEIAVDSMTLPADDDEKLYHFKVKDSETAILNDRDGRMSYDFFSEDGRQVQVQMLKYQALSVGDSNNEDSIDWWLILIIVLVALAIIVVISYFAYNYYQKYLVADEQKRIAEEELEVAETGVGGFFELGGVNHVQDNPLHGDTYADGTGPISLGDQQAQIILEDGDEEFKFTPRQFKQVQGRDKDNPSSLQVSPASNPRDNRGRDFSGASDMSVQEIDPESLPAGFR